VNKVCIEILQVDTLNKSVIMSGSSSNKFLTFTNWTRMWYMYMYICVMYMLLLTCASTNISNDRYTRGVIVSHLDYSQNQYIGVLLEIVLLIVQLQEQL